MKTIVFTAKIVPTINEMPLAGDDCHLLRQAVEIYTIDGRLVRRQATSLEGLKGIYLIGNKKVLVK